MDLPGWDRVLAHLGRNWREEPELYRYLSSVRGVAWLNGLLYPPSEVQGEWQKARRRYRRLFAWLWVGVGLGAGGLLLIPSAESVGLALLLGGAALFLYAVFALFGGRSPRDGWAETYSPFQKGEREEEGGGYGEGREEHGGKA
ncbi:MAG: hypothetical protein P3W93_008660 [Thermus sp.]|nr:hypothetical protein [Thermus sp.]